ncbi:hypothetical protein PCAR4_140042 [Paraburkholderia caribensis]|nr:hypothetical protein PCAR4_140042 [Paraburkholderia caribensis]
MANRHAQSRCFCMLAGYRLRLDGILGTQGHGLCLWQPHPCGYPYAMTKKSKTISHADYVFPRALNKLSR